MNKLLMLSVGLILLSGSLFAELTSEVSLRFSRRDGAIRIVLESDESLIKNANTIASLSSIKIEFPAHFELKRPGDFIYEILKKDHFLVINLKDITDIRTYKLDSPSRLVFDLTEEKKPDAIQSGGQDTPNTSQTKPQGFFRNILQAPKSAVQEKKRELKIVVIDPGHGGYDYGVSAEGVNEKEATLSLAKDLRFALAKKEKKTFITRSADQYSSIDERILFINGRNPDLLISMHASLSDTCALYIAATDDQPVDAVSELYGLSSRQNRHIEDSRTAAISIGKAFAANLGKKTVVRELPLPILRSINAPAVLIECPLAKVFSDQKERSLFVNSVIQGISDYEK